MFDIILRITDVFCSLKRKDLSLNTQLVIIEEAWMRFHEHKITSPYHANRINAVPQIAEHGVTNGK